MSVEALGCVWELWVVCGGFGASVRCGSTHRRPFLPFPALELRHERDEWVQGRGRGILRSSGGLS